MELCWSRFVQTHALALITCLFQYRELLIKASYGVHMLHVYTGINANVADTNVDSKACRQFVLSSGMLL